MLSSSFRAPALVVAGLLTAISGCAPVIADRDATPAAPEVVPRPAASAVGPRRAPVTLVIDRVEGAEAARTRAAFAPVVERRIAECQPTGNGVIRLRLVSRAGSSRFTVEPETTLDPRARVCVLETLSTVEIEGISGDASPSSRPSGFSALFRIEW
jgi:hypothetical protein